MADSQAGATAAPALDRDGGQRLRTYPLPTLLADGLDSFTIVDVSIEPYDGNPEHSRNSQVRGTLPE